MKFISLLLVFLMSFWADNPLTSVTRRNNLKLVSEEVLDKKDYQRLVAIYRQLEDSVSETQSVLNLAHAYFQAEMYEDAEKQYLKATQILQQPILASDAFQQLGNLQAKQGNLEQSLIFYKNALQKDASNEVARYNYELVFQQLKQNNPTQPPQNQQEKSSKNTKKQQEKSSANTSNQQETGNETSREVNKENANMLLEAFEETERNYSGQKRPIKTAPRQKGLPDW